MTKKLLAMLVSLMMVVAAAFGDGFGDTKEEAAAKIKDHFPTFGPDIKMVGALKTLKYGYSYPSGTQEIDYVVLDKNDKTVGFVWIFNRPWTVDEGANVLKANADDWTFDTHDKTVLRATSKKENLELVYYPSIGTMVLATNAGFAAIMIERGKAFEDANREATKAQADKQATDQSL